jgi:Rrf2 family protein
MAEAIDVHMTRRTDYAVRIMIELASAGGRTPARELGVLADVTYPFARSIITDLATAGLVDARRGPGGGVALDRPAREISLLEIIDAIEGRICLNACVRDDAYCTRIADCRAHAVWADATRNLNAYLASQDLQSLANSPVGPDRAG